MPDKEANAVASDLDAARAAVASVRAGNTGDVSKLATAAMHLQQVVKNPAPHKAVLVELREATKALVSQYRWLAKDLEASQEVFDHLASRAGR